MGVPEVWRYQQVPLTILELQASGESITVDASVTFSQVSEAQLYG